MRNLILADKKIDKDELLTLLDHYADFIEQHTNIECEFYVEQRDYTFVPTTPDSDGDLKPTYAYRKAMTDEVHKRYKDYGCDNIVMLVHEDNFLFKGVWGVSWNYVHHKYSFNLARWDKDNSANTLGTINHEIDHSFDTMILKEIGIDIRRILGVSDYDEETTHGAHPDYDYIRFKENADKLKVLAPYLTEMYKSRKKKHMVEMNRLTAIASILSTVVALLTKLINRPKDVPAHK